MRGVSKCHNSEDCGDPGNSSFRPDIEGLRAVAILLVIAAHAGVPWLAGGFIGVDVFFVLSGYLITRLLADELTRTGSLQFARFYARRFRRLLPALLLMLCVTALLGAQLAPVSQQGWQADAAAAAALWSSNLLFAFSRLDYFGSDASGNLFLHSWSLGVEEQFYLAWPLLLVVGYGAWRKSAPPSRLNLIQLLWLLAAISFAACVFITSIEPRHAFYLMPMRAWQFALGGLASLYFIDGTSADDGRPAASVHLLGWIGLALIIGSALALDSHTTYPGAWALLPTLGTLAVLVCGARGICGTGRFCCWARWSCQRRTDGCACHWSCFRCCWHGCPGASSKPRSVATQSLSSHRDAPSLVPCC